MNHKPEQMRRVRVREKDYMLPENWQECDRDDMAIVTELLYTHKLYETAFFVSLALNLLSLRNKKLLRTYMKLDRLAEHERKRGGHFFQEQLTGLKDELYRAARPLREWVTDKPTATVPLWPELCHGKYRCTRPGMTDLRYIDYVQADAACRDYFQAGNDAKAQQALNRLMCALYAPVSSKGSRKPIPEDDAKAMKRMEADMAAQPLQVKLAALVFFESCNALLLEEFPMIFSGSDNGDGECRFGPVGLIIEVAGEKFGDVDKTAESNLYTLLTYLEKEAIKYDEFKRKYKK